MKRSLVTGATGFIGRALCKALCERGDEVVATSLHGGIVEPDLPVQALDLGSDIPVDPSILSDVDCVYHLAGIAHQFATLDTYTTVNVEGTLALAAAASQAGVGRFVFLSSVKAMGGNNADSLRAETDVCDIAPGSDPYGWSKQQAELRLLANYADHAMRIQIVRPALVYGAQAKGNLASLIRASSFSLGRPPCGGGRSMISLPDLIALLLLLEQDVRPGIHTWTATDREQYSARRLYDALRKAQGFKPASFGLHRMLWWLACQLLELRAQTASGSTWEKLVGVELYSSQKSKNELGFMPKWQFEDIAGSIVAHDKAREGRR